MICNLNVWGTLTLTNAPHFFLQYVTDDIRNYTVNVICGFIVIPKGETFDFPFILVVLVEDAGEGALS